jgi:hypothetical protein
MSRSGQDPNEPEGFDERELIDAEFESMVAGLSLDESTPTTYLDELDAIDQSNRFTPQTPPKTSLRSTFKDAIKAIKKWRGGDSSDGDGAVI